jgi:uncharacterized alkaline shock family protein YloU
VTAVTAPGSANRPGADLVRASPAALRPPEIRGRTEIAGRVLERIAARAVTEVDQAGGAARRLLGVPLGRDTVHAAPRATAHVDGQLATVQLRMSVTYPAPIREVTRRVRDQIITRVGEVTGLDVRQVDIEIARLIRPGQEPRRVL